MCAKYKNFIITRIKQDGKAVSVSEYTTRYLSVIDKQFYLVRSQKRRKALISFIMSICLSVCLFIRKNISSPTRRIFMKFYIWWFFFSRKYVEKVQGWLTYDKSGFGGLELACWPLVPKFAGSNPAEAVGFFRAKKSSARLPSEEK